MRAKRIVTTVIAKTNNRASECNIVIR